MSMKLEMSDLDLPSITLENRNRFTQHQPVSTLQFDVEREDTPDGRFGEGCVSARVKKARVVVEWEESNLGDFHGAFGKAVEEGGRHETDAFVIEGDSDGVRVTHKVRMLGREEFSVGMSIHVARAICEAFADWIEEFGE